jgi:hypothetical protein
VFIHEPTGFKIAGHDRTLQKLEFIFNLEGNLTFTTTARRQHLRVRVLLRRRHSTLRSQLGIYRAPSLADPDATVTFVRFTKSEAELFA